MKQEVEEPRSPIERIGAHKALRAVAKRIAESVGHILGAMGVTLIVTTQEGDANPKTGKATFSTWTYLAWTNTLQQLVGEDRESIALEHLRAAAKATQTELDDYSKLIEKARATRLESQRLKDGTKGES